MTHDKKQAPLESSGLSRRGFLQTAGVAGAFVQMPLQAQAQSGSARQSSAPLPLDGTARSSAQAIELKVNGHVHQLVLEPRVTLLDALREHLNLMGTKKGCDRGQCGACTVLVDGQRINSCLTLAVMQEGAEITTIEGLGSPNALHPLQAAFVEHDAFQCGYCTPGQICSALGMLNEVKAGAVSAVSTSLTQTQPLLSAEEIRERMSGNICRCGAYPNIVQAVKAVSGSTGLTGPASA